MQHFVSKYRGLGLLMELNWDRGVSVLTLFCALAFAGWIGNF